MRTLKLAGVTVELDLIEEFSKNVVGHISVNEDDRRLERFQHSVETDAEDPALFLRLNTAVSTDGNHDAFRNA